MTRINDQSQPKQDTENNPSSNAAASKPRGLDIYTQLVADKRTRPLPSRSPEEEPKKKRPRYADTTRDGNTADATLFESAPPRRPRQTSDSTVGHDSGSMMQQIEADIQTGFQGIFKAKTKLTQEVERHATTIRDLRAELEKQDDVERGYAQELRTKTWLIREQESKIKEQVSVIERLREQLRAHDIEPDYEHAGKQVPVIEDQFCCKAHPNKILQLEKMLTEEREHTIEKERELEYLRATNRIRLDFFREFFVETYPVNLRYRLLETARQIKALSEEWEEGRKSKEEE